MIECYFEVSYYKKDIYVSQDVLTTDLIWITQISFEDLKLSIVKSRKQYTIIVLRRLIINSNLNNNYDSEVVLSWSNYLTFSNVNQMNLIIKHHSWSNAIWCFYCFKRIFFQTCSVQAQSTIRLFDLRLIQFIQNFEQLASSPLLLVDLPVVILRIHWFNWINYE